MGTPHVVRQAQWLMLAVGVALMPAGLAAALFAAVMPRSKRSWLGPREWLFTEVAFTWFLDRYLFRRRRPQLPPVPDLNYTPPPLPCEPGFVRAVASQTGYGRPVLSALDACVCARAAPARGPASGPDWDAQVILAMEDLVTGLARLRQALPKAAVTRGREPGTHAVTQGAFTQRGVV